MFVKCINVNGHVNNVLTLNRVYKVICKDKHGNFTIVDDRNDILTYYKNRFLIVEEV